MGRRRRGSMCRGVLLWEMGGDRKVRRRGGVNGACGM